jgi:hypothetical protein
VIDGDRTYVYITDLQPDLFDTFREFLREQKAARGIESLELSWLNPTGFAEAPMTVAAVFPYRSEEEVRAFAQTMKDAFPGYRVRFGMPG